MVLKAKRNYKETVAKKESKQVKSDKAKIKKQEEENQYEAQCNEFETFLRKAVAKDKPFQFLVDMHEKLIVHGFLLTDNMANAVRKCMKREEEWAKKREEQQKASEAGDYPTITIKVKPFIMKDLKLDSRIITGKVKAESAKAWLIEGHADMLENMSWCCRCGRQLKEPASQITGMGETCAGNAGVPYDPTNVLKASKKERTKIRKQFTKKLHAQKFERWIPKSQAEVFEG